MLNQTVLTGNLGADPEVFYSSEEHPVATFNLAFRVAKKKTGWIKVVCFGKPLTLTGFDPSLLT
jgi:single-strand DNA-binding protein